MTFADFISLMPGIIVHDDYGPGILKVLEDTASAKAVCYQHRDNKTFETYGSSWDALYHQVIRQLKQKGYSTEDY